MLRLLVAGIVAAAGLAVATPSAQAAPSTKFSISSPQTLVSAKVDVRWRSPRLALVRGEVRWSCANRARSSLTFYPGGGESFRHGVRVKRKVRCGQVQNFQRRVAWPSRVRLQKIAALACNPSSSGSTSCRKLTRPNPRA